MQLTLIAVPYDSGRLLERTGAGPRHLLSSGLPEQLRSADHDVEVVEILLSDGFHTEVTGGVELMRRAAEAAAAARAAGRVPIVLSGTAASRSAP